MSAIQAISVINDSLIAEFKATSMETIRQKMPAASKTAEEWAKGFK